MEAVDRVGRSRVSMIVEFNAPCFGVAGRGDEEREEGRGRAEEDVDTQIGKDAGFSAVYVNALPCKGAACRRGVFRPIRAALCSLLGAVSSSNGVCLRDTGVTPSPCFTASPCVWFPPSLRFGSFESEPLPALRVRESSFLMTG
jgi:hypothetical protein